MLEVSFTQLPAVRIQGSGYGAGGRDTPGEPPAMFNPHLDQLGRLTGEMILGGEAITLDGLAIRFTDGYAASASALKRALVAVRDEGRRPGQDVRWPWIARRVAPDLFDDDTWHALATRNVQIAREAGALAVLPLALNLHALLRCFEGSAPPVGMKPTMVVLGTSGSVSTSS